MEVFEGVKIHRARVKDISKIIFLGRQIKEFICSNEAKFYSRDELEDWIKKPKQNIILVMFKNGKFAGFLCARMISIYWCVIDTIAVKENFRKSGLAGLLLDHFYIIIRKKNICYIQALVGDEFAETKKFWKEKGFKEGRKLIWFDKFI